MKVNLNAVNKCRKGTNIYTEGDSLYSIAFLIKGSVQIHHMGAKYEVGSGTFLALNDVITGKYQSSYTALEDLVFYAFAIDNKEDLENILSLNNEYHGFIIASLNKAIYELDNVYQSTLNHGQVLYGFLTEQYKLYSESAAKLGYTVKKPQWVDELTDLDNEIEPDRKKIDYYRECTEIPIEVVKSFYSYSNIMTLYQMEEQIELINQLNGILKQYVGQLLYISECLINDRENSLFGLVASYAIEVVNADGNCDEQMETMDSIIEVTNNIETFFYSKLGCDFYVDKKWMEELYNLLLTGTKNQDMSAQAYLRYSIDEMERATIELTDSFQKILTFADIEEDKASKMQEHMSDFVNLKDRMSMDENARAIRKNITNGFYELYKAVFMKAYHSKKAPRIIDMFLIYGYADERLLTKEQVLSLYFIKDNKKSNDGKIHNIKEWLTLIYEGQREPSKNEFDQDYNDMILSLKKKGQLDVAQVRELNEDREKKLDYEINNMFRYNNRIASGQITTFVPVLHKDSIIINPDKSYVTRKKIIQCLQSVIDIDYSIFDKEVLYVNKQKNIEKEYIVKRVYPDIILMPTVGNNGVMWQDITGKKRDSSGRFMLPIFCEANLFLNMVKICGRFRWESCRTIEGMAWNDIKHKSLTSEYSDYLQFYRKNKDLSEERKEKLKLQIQKGRNNSREIFVIDYAAWVIYESKGAIKLNKPVRDIMATYCPFSKKIREKLLLQPIFEDAYARYNRNRLKKIREIEGRHRMLIKDKVEITKELVDTLSYYKET
ncbi:MAG: hypothetical protein GX321_05670 [Clostridiales bacterium]|nr:hypothetical protein [Clostridiales bacterium]